MIRAILFDLDETLYPPGSELIRAVDRRITIFVARRLSIGWHQADELRLRLWREHGTTARGLQVLCDCEPRELHRFCASSVDPADYLQRDPDLRKCLAELRPPKHLFTNAPLRYSQRALEALGVAEEFDRLFGIEFCRYRPKPDPLPYRWVVAELGVSPHQLLMVDDNPANLRPAAELGMQTVLVGPRPDPDGHRRVRSVLEVPLAL